MSRLETKDGRTISAAESSVGGLAWIMGFWEPKAIIHAKIDWYYLASESCPENCSLSSSLYLENILYGEFPPEMNFGWWKLRFSTKIRFKMQSWVANQLGCHVLTVPPTLFGTGMFPNDLVPVGCGNSRQLFDLLVETCTKYDTAVQRVDHPANVLWLLESNGIWSEIESNR